MWGVRAPLCTYYSCDPAACLQEVRTAFTTSQGPLAAPAVAQPLNSPTVRALMVRISRGMHYLMLEYMLQCDPRLQCNCIPAAVQTCRLHGLIPCSISEYNCNTAAYIGNDAPVMSAVMRQVPHGAACDAFPIAAHAYHALCADLLARQCKQLTAILLGTDHFGSAATPVATSRQVSKATIAHNQQHSLPCTCFISSMLPIC